MWMRPSASCCILALMLLLHSFIITLQTATDCSCICQLILQVLFRQHFTSFVLANTIRLLSIWKL